MTFGRITAVLTAIFAGFLAFIFALPHMPWILPASAAEHTQGVDDLFRLMMVVGGGLYIFIQGFLLYFVWIYRKKPEDDDDAIGRALHGDNRLEIAWTVAPAIFLVILTILSLRVFDDLNLDQMEEGATVIDVTGRQFMWSFEHPETGISESSTLTLQKGQPVTFRITAPEGDVIHSFWVPHFRIKQDATPGFIRTVNVTPNQTGEFPIRCAEFCGIDHSKMRGTVRVLDKEAYLAWEQEEIAAMKAAEKAAEEAGELVARGIEVYQEQGCNACHVLEAANATGEIGPTHEKLAATAAKRIESSDYSGTATSAEEYIRESIRNPSAYVVPDYPPSMPPFDEGTLSEEDLNALVELLMQQK